MIKEMKGWKVISVYNGRKSARVSTYINYPLNVEVKPYLEGSKLFFFKEYEYAMNFSVHGEKIVPCIARNVTKPKYMLDNVYYIYHFWQWKNKHPNRSIKEYTCNNDDRGYIFTNCPLIKEAPKGTYWAESIICLK